jgi:hypothetical protein
MAIMGMPKATMNENDRVPFGKNEVGSARQSGVNAEAETQGVKALPQRELGSGVLSANAGHHPATDLLAYNINHWRLGVWAPAVRLGRLSPE